MRGHEIKALRTRLGLTQQALADIVEVTSNTVARWERDELGVSIGMADRLLAVATSLPSGAAISRTAGVALDPHHRAILDALNGRLDPDVFELCAAELLRVDWPGLVPIRGGQDDGFDGAVADGRSQEPFPLVVTTGTELVRNLRASLDSAQRKGWNPQRLLFATSQRITAGVRRKLFAAAGDRRVLLAQSYDQDWFASRLYHEPRWSKRLLGVTGRPRALSVFPVSQRPILGDDILGREREKQWLLGRPGDCLLVGEPGSGKTFLLRALALEGEALFLVDEDREKVADDVRSLKPKAVIVDDAHVRPGSIGALTQLRSEVHADFRIIATCWPGEAEGMLAELQVGHSEMLTLDLVDADTMIGIIKSAGIQGPNELLYAIRTQAAGRPGLAATLTHLCLIGDISAATTGEGLVNAIAPDLDRVLGVDSMTLLAPFALGGDSGARQEDVANQLNMSLLETRSSLAKLGAAGIIRNRGSGIAVEPPPMRWVIVRRVFFGGVGSLPVERFLPAALSRTDALGTLIGARSRGAGVPELERLLEETGSEGLWADYAAVGPDTTRYALARHPELIHVLAEPALVHLPGRTIPILLSGAENTRSGGVSLQAALHPLERWIRSGNSQGSHEAIDRRVTLVRCADAWWRQSRNSHVCLAAMCLALDPDFDFVTQDPGAGNSIIFAQAILGSAVIDALATTWPAVMTVVKQAGDVPWTSLIDLVTGWSRARMKAEHGTSNAANRILSHMLKDLALASQRFPGVQHRLAEIARRANVAVETALDSDFECLYPQDPYDSDDVTQELRRLEENARQLAKCWESRTADELATFLARHETEARRGDVNYPRMTPVFCRALATACKAPLAATQAFIRERLSADLVEWFAGEALRRDRSAWSIVSECFHDALYVGMGVRLAICRDTAPRELVRSALTKVNEIPRLLEDCCVTGEISRLALSEALRSQDASTAVSAAIGHWKGPGRPGTDHSLAEPWRRAFLRSSEITLSSLDGYWTGEILKRDAELAVEWLIRCLDSDQAAIGFDTQETARKAIPSLDSSQRTRVLNAHHPDAGVFGVSEIIHALVGCDPEVYERLLELEKLKPHHLSPLQGEPNDGWRNLAVLALDHGYSCEDVVDANLTGPRSWQGNASEMWTEYRHRFEKLREDDDSRIVEVGQLGALAVSGREKSAKEREREEAVYGLS